MSFETIQLTKDGPRATVTITRPEVRNAFDDRVVRELTEAFESLGNDDATRVIVLAGEGKVFSAGADLNWMQGMVGYSEAENIRDAEAIRLLAVGPHSPKEVRCNAVVSNLDAFHEAFDVQESDALFTRPDRRVRIW